MRREEPLRPEEVLAAASRARRRRLLLSGLVALGLFLGGAPTGAAGETSSAEVLSTSEAIRRWQIAASPWPDDIKRAVIARDVRPGFTRDQVLLALAEPDRVEGPPGAARWVYLTGAGAGQVIRFRGETVEQVDRPQKVDGLPGLPFGASRLDAVRRWPALRAAGAAGGAARLEGPIVFAGQATHASLFFADDRLTAVNLYTPAEAFDPLADALLTAYGAPDDRIDDAAGQAQKLTWIRGGTVAFASRCCAEVPGRRRQTAVTLLDARRYTGGASH